MTMKTLACSTIAATLAYVLIQASAPLRAGAEEAFDINEVFWCESGNKTGEQSEAECIEARTLILFNCTGCHAITPIVKAQKTEEQWLALIGAHRDRVPDVSEDDLARMTEFLQFHYNPQNPVPELPPELEALGVPPA